MGEQKREEWIARPGRRWEGSDAMVSTWTRRTVVAEAGAAGGERVRESQSGVVCGLWTVDWGLRREGLWCEGERARCDELDDAVVLGKMRRNGGG